MCHGLTHFKTLACRYLGPDYGDENAAPHGVVLAAQLPALARQSFPLCMKVRDQSLDHESAFVLILFRRRLGYLLLIHIPPYAAPPVLPDLHEVAPMPLPYPCLLPSLGSVVEHAACAPVPHLLNCHLLC